jgi:hypothetical protein
MPGGARRGHEFFGNQYTKVAKYSRRKTKGIRRKLRRRGHLYAARAYTGASLGLTGASLAVSTSLVGVGVGIGLGVASGQLSKRANVSYGRYMGTKAGRGFKPFGSTPGSRKKMRSAARKALMRKRRRRS